MTDLRKTAEMALEALDSDNPDIQLRAAIILRQALETEQEPVAYIRKDQLQKAAQSPLEGAGRQSQRAGDGDAMTKEDIIRMAREAGGNIYEVDWCFEVENLQRFAALVEQGVARKCAELCDDLHDEYEGEDILAIWCAEGIRAYYKLQEPQ